MQPQVEEVMTWLASLALPGEPLVLAGDFNAPPFYSCHQLCDLHGLADAWNTCLGNRRSLQRYPHV